LSHEFDESYDAYCELFPTARKEHRCAACNEVIRPGDQYARISIIWEGVERIARCLRCQTLHEHLRELDPAFLWPDERLDCGEEYREHWGKEPPPEVAALAFMTQGEMQAFGRRKVVKKNDSR
jgi:predicted RNA-binding Zn-ribbon protein involved in translation (DUF1610 family)